MNTFDFVKSKIAILDVVSQYSTLKKAGIYWKGRCPFHHEKTASFTVSPHKEIFYCFGCHEGGDVIAFIAKIEQCSPLEAAQSLAQRYNLTLPTNQPGDKQSAQKTHQQFYELNKLFATWCHEQLKTSHAALSYMHQRGFTNELIDTFMIGYLPGGLQIIKKCIDMFRSHHFLLQDLINIHLVMRGKTSIYSPFEERIIFPIKDHLGRFCGFGGRIFKPDDTRPKYYNSKESDYFLKGSLIFGLDGAKKAIQASGTAFLVEGYTDCMAMVQHGFDNSIATLGTACTTHHLKLIGRYAHTLFVLYDSDQAGKNAILRLFPLSWQANIDLRVIILPPGYDPASFLAAGHNLKPLIAQSRELLVFLIESYGDTFSSQPLSQKMQTMHAILQAIASIEEPLKQDLLLQRTANLLNMPFDSLKKELARLCQPAKSTTKVMEPDQPTKSYRPPIISSVEQRFFCAIVNNFDYLNNKNLCWIIDYLQEPLRGILKMALEQYQEDHHHHSFSSFFARLDPEQQLVVSKIIAEHDEKMNAGEFSQLTIELYKKYWKLQINAIQKKLAKAEQKANKVEMSMLLEQFLELKQQLLQVQGLGSKEDN